MSRKTVSRGAAAAALATLLTVASAAPTLAAPRSAGERGLTARISVWSLVWDVSKRMTGWAFGIDAGFTASKPARGITDKITMGADPNGNQMTADPTEATGRVPVFGGG